jgi:uncharacterized protein
MEEFNRFNLSKASAFVRVLIIVLFIISSCQSNLHLKEGSDEATEVPKVYPKANVFEHQKIRENSLYLTMRDGVKIAVDYYLPADLPEETKIPTIIHQTRYWRSIGIRPFANLFLDQFLIQRELGITKEKFIKHGYAWVDVDTRGSGASFGYRKSEWSEDEIKDGNEIVNWILNQEWSNGNIGAFGVSYSGTTAEFLLKNNHPAVKAVVPMFTMFDVYSDVAFPGGIQLSGFTKEWGAINNLLDNNILPSRAGWKGKIALTGVKAVKGQEKLLSQALMDHGRNWDVHADASTIDFRDEPNSYGITVDDFSIHNHYEDVNKANVPIYVYSGWYDGAYGRAAIKKFNAIQNPNKKLIIGPWNHGGEQNASPFAYNGFHEDHFDSGFDHFAEVLKFFDTYLKNERTGIEDEKPIHYYTVGEEKWKATDVWPPKADIIPFYFSSNKSMEKYAAGNGIDVYNVDTTATTGDRTRWHSLLGGSMVVYSDRRQEDEKLIYYDSAPLEKDTEVTGHPLVTLFLSVNAEDCSIFVYLEDVDESGKVTLVTEGNLRGINRKISQEASLIDELIPFRTYLKKDALPMEKGKVTELVFDLLPISYQFKKGHKIRVAIAGADKDIFKKLPDAATEFKIYRTENYTSKIDLPIIEAPNYLLSFQ